MPNCQQAAAYHGAMALGKNLGREKFPDLTQKAGS